MVAISVEELYERHIKPLSPAERLRLIALMAQGLAQPETAAGETPKRSIMELHGLGAEICEGIDASEYVHQLREEACPKACLESPVRPATGMDAGEEIAAMREERGDQLS